MKVTILDPSCFSMFYDHYLCESLVRQNCDVTFIGSRYLYSDWNYETNYKKENLFYNLTNLLYRNKPVGVLRTEIKGSEHCINMYNLVNYLKRLKPTIIHFQWIPFPLVDCLFIKFLKSIAPTVLTVHDVYPYHDSQSSKIQLLYYNTLLKQFNHLIVHTQSSLKIINADLKIPIENLSVIPHGVFDHYSKMHTCGLKLKSKYKVVLFFGTIKSYKGIDILIKAFAKLPENVRKKSILLIVGNPKIDINPLKFLAEDLKISKFIQWKLGYVSEEEVANILKRATIFVLPYKYFESQSGALMAMLPFGKPIIATKLSGFTEVLKDEIHGYLIEPEDSSALTKALLSILTNPKKFEKMSKAVRQLAEETLSWNSIARKTINVYKNLLKHKQIF